MPLESKIQKWTKNLNRNWNSYYSSIKEEKLEAVMKLVTLQQISFEEGLLTLLIEYECFSSSNGMCSATNKELSWKLPIFVGKLTFHITEKIQNELKELGERN